MTNCLSARVECSHISTSLSRGVAFTVNAAMEGTNQCRVNAHPRRIQILPQDEESYGLRCVYCYIRSRGVRYHDVMQLNGWKCNARKKKRKLRESTENESHEKTVSAAILLSEARGFMTDAVNLRTAPSPSPPRPTSSRSCLCADRLR